MAKNEELEYVTPAGVKVSAPPHINKPKSQFTVFNGINGFILYSFV